MPAGLGGGMEGGRWEMVPFQSRLSHTLKFDIFFLWGEEAAGAAGEAALPLLGEVTGSWT